MTRETVEVLLSGRVIGVEVKRGDVLKRGFILLIGGDEDPDPYTSSTRRHRYSKWNGSTTTLAEGNTASAAFLNPPFISMHTSLTLFPGVLLRNFFKVAMRTVHKLLTLFQD